MRRCIYCVDDDEYWRHGAAGYRRWMRLDGRAQGGGAVWCHGGVDGRLGKVYASVPALEMDRWKTAAAASVSAPDRCVTQSRYVAGMGHPALDVRFWCDVCLVLGSDIWHPCIKGIGVATGVAKMVDPGLLMYSFVKSL